MILPSWGCPTPERREMILGNLRAGCMQDVAARLAGATPEGLTAQIEAFEDTWRRDQASA